MRRVIFGIIVFTLYLCACGAKHYDRYNFTTKIGIDDILLEADGKDVCVALSSDKYRFVLSSIKGDIIALPDIKARAYSNEHFQRRYIYDKYTISIYEIGTKKLIKEYDLYKIQTFLKDQSRKDGMSYELKEEGGTDIIRYNNNNYLRILLNYDWAEDKIDVKTGFLYINIDTDEMQIEDDNLATPFNNSGRELKYANRIDSLSQEYPWKSLENSILVNNGFSYTWVSDYNKDKSQKIFDLGYEVTRKAFEPGVVELIVSTNALPQNNEALYKKFPELKNWQGQEGNMAIFHLSGYPTPEEILGLFVEDDKGISFDNCILSSEYSKDGKEHKIGSFEELDEWYKP